MQPPPESNSEKRPDLPVPARVAGVIMAGARRTADFILPPLCISCRTPVGGHGLLCAACWSQVAFIEPPLCERLGVPLPFDAGEGTISAAALADPPVYNRARVVARYDDVMRALIHKLKYKDRQEGVKLFGRWLAHAGRELTPDADLILPVPLFRWRLWARRFNQASLLADALARETGLPAAHFLLSRIRRTRTQVGLTASQRRKNVAGAFHVAPSEKSFLAGKNILLLDDIITTGATSDACTKVLLRAGAARVDILALARVTNPEFINI